MRRDRVAVIGRRGLFQDSVIAALASKRRLHVRRFSLDDQDTTSCEISAFGPDVVVVVGSIDQPVPEAVLPQMEKGVAIVTLDPAEPAMSFSRQEHKAPATLENVLGAVRASRLVLSGERPR